MTSPAPITHTVVLQPDLPLTLAEAGSGRPVVILHGGGGPFTVAGIADHLSATTHTLTPTHPGWNGTPRPGRIASVHDVARAYLHLLGRWDLRDVLVIGSSLGGWIGAEMALGDGGGRISGLVLIAAVGVAVEGEPIRDVFAPSPRELAGFSFYDPERFFVDPARMPPEQQARQRANRATMRALAGEPYIHDPTLRGRLGGVRVPTLVLWGESDRVVTPAYGRAYAAAFPHAQFVPIPAAGHLPHLERPDVTFALLDGFVNVAR